MLAFILSIFSKAGRTWCAVDNVSNAEEFCQAFGPDSAIGIREPTFKGAVRRLGYGGITESGSGQGFFAGLCYTLSSSESWHFLEGLGDLMSRIVIV